MGVRTASKLHLLSSLPARDTLKSCANDNAVHKVSKKLRYAPDHRNPCCYAAMHAVTSRWVRYRGVSETVLGAAVPSPGIIVVHVSIYKLMAASMRGRAILKHGYDVSICDYIDGWL